MELNRKERLFLINQFEILKRLDEDNEEWYDRGITVLENGYESHYDNLFERVEEDGLSAIECREVLDILEMYRSITFSYNRLEEEEKEEFSDYEIRFAGFDYNDAFEYKRGKYVEYFILELNRYHELQYDGEHTDYNSHSQQYHTYLRMLDEWRNSPNRNNLTKDDIRRIINAR